jgi:hypothetical protein
MKWQNWKMMNKELDTGTGVVKEWGIPRIFNLYLDPKLLFERKYGHRGIGAANFECDGVINAD